MKSTVGTSYGVGILVSLMILVSVVSLVSGGDDVGPHRGGGGGKDECPAMCQCIYFSKRTSCRHFGLVQVPQIPSLASQIVDLDHNHISLLANASLVTLATVRVLSIQHNQIVRVEPGAFRPLPELQVLRLGSNMLTNLPVKLFELNRRLEHLDLSGNAFVALPDHAFYHLHSLLTLNLSSNHIASPVLGPGFKSTQRLINIDLSRNSLVQIESHAFDVSTHWERSGPPRSLNLSWANIHHIRQGAFRHVTRLRQLSLEGNGELTFVEVRNALKDLDVSSLEDLNIAWCNLSDVAGIFRRDDFKKLSRLVLSHNSIQKVAHGAFYYLISLTELDVQFNKLNSVGDLSALARLERLILSHNVINTLSETSFEGLQNLRHLDLSFNELQELTDGPLENLWELQELDVSSNRLEVIQIETGLENLRHLRLVSNRLTDARFIQRLPRLQTLDLSDNRITALEQYCVVQSLRLANFSGNRIHSIHWSAFHGASVRTLDLSHNHLQMVGTWQWPSKLVNLHLDSNLIQNVSTEGFKGLKDLELLHLADNQLTHLPRSLPDDAANIGDLDLSGNPLGDYMLSLGSGGGGRMLVRLRGLQFLSLSRTQLQRIPTDVFAQFTYSPLQRVDFSQNAIAELPASRTFRALTHLKHLDLSQNRISYVDPDIFEYMPALRHIDLTYNPWQCSCDLLPFLRWAFAPVRWAFVPDRDTLTLANLGQAGVYVCDSPVSMRGLNLDGFVTSGTVQGLEQCAEREGGDDVSGGGGGGGHYRSPWSFRGAGAPSTALVVGGGFLVFLAVALLTGAICVCACSSKARQRRDGDSDPTHSKYLSIRDQHASNQTTPAHAPAQNKAQIVWL